MGQGTQLVRRRMVRLGRQQGVQQPDRRVVVLSFEGGLGGAEVVGHGEGRIQKSEREETDEHAHDERERMGAIDPHGDILTGSPSRRNRGTMAKESD